MTNNIQTFESISQRVLFTLRIAYSDFSPVESESVSPENQRILHTIMNDIQEKLYNNPQLLSLPADIDEAYPWNLCNNQKPELNAVYLSVFKTLYDFYLFLYTISRDGELSDNIISISKKQLKMRKSSYKPLYENILHTVGIDVITSKECVTLCHQRGEILFAALKLLGDKCNRVLTEIPEGWRDSASLQHNLFLFAACCFIGNVNYLLNHIDELYGLNGLLIKLKKTCIIEGYIYNCRIGISQSDITFNIEIKYGVGGFLIVYNTRKAQKVGFGTMNGIGEKAMLEDFDNLDDEMKKYFLSICQPCSGCLGCTKGGKSKPFTVKVNLNGCDYNLCPVFPNHSWDYIDEALIKKLMKYHSLQQKYAK